ncbi:hypothetical protein GCM10027091_60910 [Streptomyces daliensis]
MCIGRTGCVDGIGRNSRIGGIGGIGGIGAKAPAGSQNGERMSFENEWAEHKTAAGSQGDSTSMRLNQADGGGGPGPVAPGTGVLATAPEQKKKAASYIEKTLAPAAKSASTMADADSGVVAGGGMVGPLLDSLLTPSQKPQWHPPMVAPGTGPGGGGAGEFNDWQTKTGLNEAMTAWERQVGNLLGRLTSYMSSLRSANNLYGLNDGLIGNQFLLPGANGQNGQYGQNNGLVPPVDGTPPLLLNPNAPTSTNTVPRSGIADY